MITTSQKNDLGPIGANAAAHLRAKGWVQGQTEDEHGRVDIMGALQAGAATPGDWAIAATVYRSLDHGEVWNDAPRRQESEVHEWLTDHPISDTDLHQTFGDQWEALVAFIRKAAALTPAETASIRGHVMEEHAVHRRKVLLARRACIEALPTDHGMYSAGLAANDVAPDAGSIPARAALAAALHRTALALSASHLITPTGFTTDDFHTLTGPWQAAVGRLTPVDGR